MGRPYCHGRIQVIRFMVIFSYRLFSLVALFSFLISAPLNGYTQKPLISKEPVILVTTFTILEECVRRVIGKKGEANFVIYNIVKPHIDPHLYQPLPEDSRRIARAKAVFMNGFGFEGWLERPLKDASFKGKVIVVSKGLQARKLLTPAKGEVVYDPHLWHDISHMISYVKAVVEAMGQIDPAHKSEYETNGKTFIASLENLDLWVRRTLQDIPQEKRLVVTTHDAFWYYGRAYGVTFLSPLGISTETEPSPASFALLIQQIRQRQIKAVFFENLTNRKLIEQISHEVKHPVDGVLYADSLSLGDGPAPSYEAMMKHNTLALVQAWK